MESSEELAARCAADGEFRLLSRYWRGGVRLEIGDETLSLAIEDGQVRPGRAEGPGLLVLRGPSEVWERILAPVPPPWFHDLLPALARGLELEGEAETFWQYYPALRRLVDLLREGANDDGAV